MRILWHGVPAEFSTGYGTQTDLFTRALRDRGHEVAISSIVPDMWRIDKNGLQVYPAGFRCSYGNDLILGHQADFKADVVVSCCDTHIMDPKKFARVWWVAWQVVDSEPFCPELAKVTPMARTRMAMSKFGARVIKKAGFDCDYVPLAIDSNLFRPTRDVQSARDQLAKILKTDPFDDKTFLVVMNSANMSAPSRKNFFAAFAGFEQARQQLEREGVRAVLYCHTEPTGAIHNGEDLCAIAEGLGIPTKSLCFPPQYPYLTGRISQEYLRGVYCAADLFLHTARGEGFGLPIVEAMSCGCPALVPSNSSMIEFGCDQYLYNQVPFASSSGTVQYCVASTNVAAELVAAWRNREFLLSEDQRLRRRLSVEQYDIGVVALILEKTLVDSYARHDPQMCIIPDSPDEKRSEGYKAIYTPREEKGLVTA